MSLLLEILVISLFILGIYQVIHIQFNKLTGKVLDDYIENKSKLIKYICSPLFYCVYCMSSVWGTIGYLFINDVFILKEWLIIIISCVGVIDLIKKL